MTSSTKPIPNVTPPAEGYQPRAWGWERSSLKDILLKPLTLSLSLAGLALKRLRFHPGLTLLALFGVVLAVGLVTSAGFFAQAVDQVILSQILTEYSRVAKRPPFSARVYTNASRQLPLSLARVETLAANVADTLTAEVGLPLKHVGLQIDSGVLPIRPRAEAGQRSLGNIHLIYMAGIEEHLTLIEGELLGEGASEGALAVWLYPPLAEKMGLQVGDEFEVALNRAGGVLPVRVQGVWRAADPSEPFWFNNPDQDFEDKLLVRRQDYINYVEPLLPVKVRAATWYVIFDETAALPAQGRDYVAGFQRAQNVIAKYLPEARLNAPSLSLEQFVQRQDTLTILLLGFNIPAFGFLLYFLMLTSAVIAYWQRREVAMLISRGMSRWSILNFTLIEELILFVLGLPLGLGLGALLARLMGYTAGFLSFSPRPPLPVSWHGLNLPLVFVTLSIVLAARLWPALQTTRQTVLEHEREHTRPIKGPVWYRYYLDLLLLIVVFYAYGQISRRGTLALLVQDRPDDLYRDPLLVLAPAFFILTIALLAMRLFPLLMRLLDVGANLTPWLTPHLALRQLGRQHTSYINPLLLVIVSLALGVYTLSLAASLDQWLIDRIYYQVGADLTFTPYSDSAVVLESAGAAWIPSPAEFAALPGVEAAARVGDYPAEITLTGGSGNKIKSRFMAVDRIDFSRVAWFRYDFAADHLGGLMNRLALLPEGVLVSQQFLEDNFLQIGDPIAIEVITDIGATVRASFTVVGTYHYFPTIYDDEVVVIGNLEYLFSFFGLPMPHRIWLRTRPGVEGQAVLQAVSNLGLDTIERADSWALISAAQAEMERVGVFGVLSLSFLAAAIMAAVGLLTYSYASLQERSFNFAVLRAVGVRQSQILGQVFLEYVFLTVYGATAGVMCGSIAARLFTPLFRVTGETGRAALPPLLPIVAQAEIIPLAFAFAGIMVLLELLIIAVALHRRLFETLRMGHQG